MPRQQEIHPSGRKSKDGRGVVRRHNHQVVSALVLDRGRQAVLARTALLNSRQFQRRPSDLEGNGFVAKPNQRHLAVPGDARVVVVAEDGIYRGQFSQRLDKPRQELRRSLPAARARGIVSREHQQVVCERTEALLCVLQDRVPSSKVQVGEVGDTQARVLRRQTLQGNVNHAYDGQATRRGWNALLPVNSAVSRHKRAHPEGDTKLARVAGAQCTRYSLNNGVEM